MKNLGKKLKTSFIYLPCLIKHCLSIINYLRKNNQIILIKNGKKFFYPMILGLKPKFKGRNSKIILHHPIKRIENLTVICGHNCCVEIEKSENYYIDTLLNAVAKNSRIRLGKNCSCNKNCNLTVDFEPNLSITLGDECMLAPNVWMRTSDGHAVLTKDNKLLNKGGNIEIGNHVWILQKSAILKNTYIPNNTIVGTYSVVNKKFDKEYTMIAGIPAKVIKEDINWSRKRPFEFEE